MPYVSESEYAEMIQREISQDEKIAFLLDECRKMHIAIFELKIKTGMVPKEHD